MLVHMYFKGDPARAIEYGEQSLAIACDLNLREQMAFSTQDLGVAYQSEWTIGSRSGQIGDRESVVA